MAWVGCPTASSKSSRGCARSLRRSARPQLLWTSSQMASVILDPNPFAKAPYATSGDLIAEHTFAAVGRALSAWEQCETMFASLYTAFVKPQGSNHTAFTAYGTVMSARSRRDMIEASADVYFQVYKDETGVLPATLSRLLKLYKDAASRRNDIAHAVVMSGPLTVTEPITYFLVPSFHTSSKREAFSFASTYRYSSQEIDLFSANVEKLNGHASKLSRDVRAFYQALPEKLRQQFA